MPVTFSSPLWLLIVVPVILLSIASASGLYYWYRDRSVKYLVFAIGSVVGSLVVTPVLIMQKVVLHEDRLDVQVSLFASDNRVLAFKDIHAIRFEKKVEGGRRRRETLYWIIQRKDNKIETYNPPDLVEWNIEPIFAAMRRAGISIAPSPYEQAP